MALRPVLRRDSSRAVVRRMLAGVPADVSWRLSQQAAARRGPTRVHIDGKAIVMNTRTALDRARLMRATRRKLPYCPVCKTKRGHDGIPRTSDWFTAR